MKKKILSIILVACMVAGMAVGCGSKSEGSDKNTTAKSESGEDDYVVQIAQGPALCSAPVFIAIINGYMEDCGVKYEYVNSENQWDLMAGGKNDINYGLLPTFVQRIANGYKMKIVGGAHFGCINMVATDASGIQSIKDLKGKNVGIPGGMGSDPAILLQRMLTAYNINITDVNLQVFDNADLATALQEGQIEAFVSWDPYATIVSEYEGNHLIFNQSDDEMTKDEYCCVFGFSDTLVEDHPEVAKNYVKALSMACDFISENPVEAAKLCYENGYVADEDYEFNGKLLESYRYKFNYEDAKASFVDVTKDLNDLGIITLNKSADKETVQGTEMYMPCHYLKIIAVILGIGLMAISVEGIIKKKVSVFLLIVTGIVCIWSTIESIGGLHICAMKEMACHTTVVWIRVLGILSVLVGCIMLYNPKKQV